MCDQSDYLSPIFTLSSVISHFFPKINLQTPGLLCSGAGQASPWLKSGLAQLGISQNCASVKLSLAKHCSLAGGTFEKSDGKHYTC